MMLKVEPQSPPTNIASAETEPPLVWPWVGVLANIPIQWKNGRFDGPSGFMLKQHLSQGGFNPFKVEILWSNRGHSGFALVEFENDLNGHNHATLFDKSFQASLCGKRDWNNAIVCPADKFKLYGWIAREDDYKFEGIVGHHLRKYRDLNGISSVKGRVPLFSHSNTDTLMHHNQLGSKVDGFSLCIDYLMKHKDHMIQRYHQDMRKTHHSAQKNLQNIISQREKVTGLLEAQKQEIEMRRTELVEREIPNETELTKIQNEKYMIDKASLEQRKGDLNLELLVEQHQKEKEEFYRRSIGFIKDVDEKHVLELDIERMRGTLRIMRHMGDAGAEEILEKMDMVEEQLKEKEQVYNGFEAMNPTLIMNHPRNNDKLQGAGKDLNLIKHLKKESRNISTGIKREEDIDLKQLLGVSKRKHSDSEEAKDLYSEWNDYLLQDPKW